MDFLDHFSLEDRDRLHAASESIRLEPGEYLLRRGDRGGDFYLIETGSLEVIDTRHRPEVVLNVVGPGAIVGEMSFMDSSPPIADVRAISESVCRHWPHHILHRVLQEESDLAAAFYQALSEEMVARVRSSPGTAVGGVIDRLVQDAGPVAQAVSTKAREITEASRSVWQDADAQLRITSGDAASLQKSREAFGVLLEASQAWIGAMGEHDRAQEAGEALRNEVLPYLGRAKLFSLAQGVGLGVHGAEFLAHILLNNSAGDSALGEVLDDSLLDLPTSRGIRARQQAAVKAVADVLPPDRSAQVTLLHPNCGALLARLVTQLAGKGGTVTVIDGDRETLSVVDLGMPQRPEGVDMRLVQESLAEVSAGVSSLHHDPQDLIVADGLVDHLPDRLVASLAVWCADHLVPGGTLICTGTAPSADACLFDHLVGWPLIRRSPAELCGLLDSVGLRAEAIDLESDDGGAGIVVQAHRA